MLHALVKVNSHFVDKTVWKSCNVTSRVRSHCMTMKAESESSFELQCRSSTQGLCTAPRANGRTAVV